MSPLRRAPPPREGGVATFLTLRKKNFGGGRGSATSGTSPHTLRPQLMRTPSLRKREKLRERQRAFRCRSRHAQTREELCDALLWHHEALNLTHAQWRRRNGRIGHGQALKEEQFQLLSRGRSELLWCPSPLHVRKHGRHTHRR